jgi:hypothetical protein
MLADRDAQMIQDIAGVTDENMGRRPNANSGIAIERRQDQGSSSRRRSSTTTASPTRCRARRRSLIEQFYTAKKVVRIVGDKKPIEWLPINASTSNGQPLNDITANEADFIVSEQDFRASLRQAQAETLMEMLGKLAPVMPQAAMNLLDLVVDHVGHPEQGRVAVKRIREINGQTDPTKKPTPEAARMKQKAQAMAQESSAARDGQAAGRGQQGQRARPHRRDHDARPSSRCCTRRCRPRRSWRRCRTSRRRGRRHRRLGRLPAARRREPADSGAERRAAGDDAAEHSRRLRRRACGRHAGHGTTTPQPVQAGGAQHGIETVRNDGALRHEGERHGKKSAGSDGLRRRATGSTESDLRTLQDAEAIEKDPKRFKAAQELAKKKLVELAAVVVERQGLTPSHQPRSAAMEKTQDEDDLFGLSEQERAALQETRPTTRRRCARSRQGIACRADDPMLPRRQAKPTLPTRRRRGRWRRRRRKPPTVDAPETTERQGRAEAPQPKRKPPSKPPAGTFACRPTVQEPVAYTSRRRKTPTSRSRRCAPRRPARSRSSWTASCRPRSTAPRKTEMLGKISDIERQVTVATTAAELTMQNAQRSLPGQRVNALMDAAKKDDGIDYARATRTCTSALDRTVKWLANDPANADKPEQWFLDEAHAMVKARTAWASQPPRRAAAGRRPLQRGPRGGKAPDLRHAAQHRACPRRPDSDDGGEFAHLDNLTGMALERASRR